LAARAAWSKQGSDIVVLEVGEVLAIVDWFVVASAANARAARTIAEEVEEQLRRHDGTEVLRTEGIDDARWVLLDFGDVAVHVFSEEARDYYDLERLWADVPHLEWQEGDRPSVLAAGIGRNAGSGAARAE
jgi:ribosome-associated protein